MEADQFEIIGISEDGSYLKQEEWFEKNIPNTLKSVKEQFKISIKEIIQERGCRTGGQEYSVPVQRRYTYTSTDVGLMDFYNPDSGMWDEIQLGRLTATIFGGLTFVIKDSLVSVKYRNFENSDCCGFEWTGTLQIWDMLGMRADQLPSNRWYALAAWVTTPINPDRWVIRAEFPIDGSGFAGKGK